jgi:hypothetical protein
MAMKKHHKAMQHGRKGTAAAALLTFNVTKYSLPPSLSRPCLRSQGTAHVLVCTSAE